MLFNWFVFWLSSSGESHGSLIESTAALHVRSIHVCVVREESRASMGLLGLCRAGRRQKIEVNPASSFNPHKRGPVPFIDRAGTGGKSFHCALTLSVSVDGVNLSVCNGCFLVCIHSVTSEPQSAQCTTWTLLGLTHSESHPDPHTMHLPLGVVRLVVISKVEKPFESLNASGESFPRISA